MPWLYIFAGLIVIAILLFYFSPSMAHQVVVTHQGPTDLGSTHTVASAEDAQDYYRNAEGSLSAFIYLNPMVRTGSHQPCGTNPNQPSCADGTFAPCPCTSPSDDCTPCAHAGYNSVINIAGILGLEMLMAPDASRQGKAMAQLVIRTEGPPLTPTATSSQKYIETLSLPPIPLQKWTMITVAREGRRFDVYYNDSVVLSQMTMFMPVANPINTNFRGIVSGSEGLLGTLALANVYNYRLKSQDVAAKYRELSDTRGTPYLGNQATTLKPSMSDVIGLAPSYASSVGASLGSVGLPNFSLCPKGGCFETPVVRPANPLYDWSTPYA
jgi:hypothetical protein